MMTFTDAMLVIRNVAKNQHSYGCSDDVFRAVANYYQHNPKAMTLNDAKALTLAEHRSSYESHAHVHDACHEAIAKMSARNKKALWLHYTATLGFKKYDALISGTNNPAYSPTESLYVLSDLSRYMLASMPRETAEELRSFLLLEATQVDSLGQNGYILDTTTRLVRGAIENGKLHPMEVLQPLFDLATNPQVNVWGVARYALYTMDKVLPEFYHLDHAPSFSAELAQKMMDTALYGVGSPPDFRLRAYFLDALAKIQAKVGIERPMRAPDFGDRYAALTPKIGL
jgi:hypothetical protein